jgi:hypothetical protein
MSQFLSLKGIYRNHNRDLSSALSSAAASATGSSTTCRAAVFFASLKAFGSLRKDSSPENFLLMIEKRKPAKFGDDVADVVFLIFVAPQ